MTGGWSLGFQGFSRAQLLLTQRLGQWSVGSGMEKGPQERKEGSTVTPHASCSRRRPEAA